METATNKGAGKMLGDARETTGTAKHSEDLRTVCVSDAARMLGFSENTVRKWIASGALHAVAEPGGRARIRMTVLREFFNSWPAVRAESKNPADSFSSNPATAALSKVRS